MTNSSVPTREAAHQTVTGFIKVQTPEPVSPSASPTSGFSGVPAGSPSPGSCAGGGCPGHLFQAMVTDPPASVRPLEVWRDYNGRAGCEEVIKQLDADFALPKWCLKKFWRTEAARARAVFSDNLGGLDQVTAAALRDRIFQMGGQQRDRRAHDDPTGGAGGRRAGVVSAVVGKTARSGCQLQSSGGEGS